MKTFKVTITERIYASCEVEVRARNEESALKKGREIAFNTPFDKWQQDTEVVGEEVQKVG